MKTIISAALVAALSLSAVAATSTTASAANGQNTAFAVGGLIGLGVGAAIASQPRYSYEGPVYYHRIDYQAHVDWCFDHHPSYDPEIDRYVGGDRRLHRCYGSY